MRILFFGSDTLGIPTLNRILASEHELLGVVTIPDQKKGRGQKLTLSPIKIWALEHQIRVLDLPDVNADESIQFLKGLNADVFIVASFGTILSDSFLNIPHQMCLNIHPSLLPKYRGASPVVQSILNGDDEAGTTIMKIAQRLDSGDILSQKKITLTGNETLTELSVQLAELSADLLMTVLADMDSGMLHSTPQNEDLATYCGKVKKSDAAVVWSAGARAIHNQVRALSIWPGVKVAFRSKRVKLIKTRFDNEFGTSSVGSIDEIHPEKGVAIQTGQGRLWVQVLQPEGGRPMPIASFMNGFKLQPGEKVEV